MSDPRINSLKKQNSRKQILIFVEHMTDGGAERVLSELITQWNKKHTQLIVVETAPEKFQNCYNLPEEVDVIKLNNSKIQLLQYGNIFVSMIRIMHQYPSASVLAFTESMIIKLALTLPLVRNRIVLSLRNDPLLTPNPKLYRRIRDWAFLKADACVFQTPDAMNYYPQQVKEKSVIIPNPINPDIPEAYTGTREKKIVAVGRLSSQKNFKMLIQAFAMLHEDYPDYPLIIFGRGEAEAELKRLAADLQVSDFVLFPGFSDNIYQDIQKSALYVSSSDYEGISNSMLEALALGIPSVVTDCPAGGARLAITDHENGILVPVGDTKSLYMAMKYMLDHPEEAERMGRNAAKIRERWPIDTIANLWLELF